MAPQIQPTFQFTILTGLFALLTACVHVAPYRTVASHLPKEKLLVFDTSTADSQTSASQSAAQRVYVESSGSGEAVILLHGFGGSSYSWRHLIPELATDYRVLAPDLNGFGFTERPRARAPYTRSGQLKLILALMDHHHLPSAHIVGHSYGGALALTLAHDHPRRVRSLTLINAAAPDYSTQRRRIFATSRGLSFLYVRGVGLRRWVIERALKRSLYDDRLVTDELVEAYRSRLAVEGIVHAYQGLTAPFDERLGRIQLSKIEQPTLALWGGEDELIPADRARIEVSKMPHAQFVLIRGGGHALMEERPAEVANRVHTFLDSLSNLPSAGHSPAGAHLRLPVTDGLAALQAAGHQTFEGHWQ